MLQTTFYIVMLSVMFKRNVIYVVYTYMHTHTYTYIHDIIYDLCTYLYTVLRKQNL